MMVLVFCAHIVAAFSHSFGSGWGRGLLSFMEVVTNQLILSKFGPDSFLALIFLRNRWACVRDGGTRISTATQPLSTYHFSVSFAAQPPHAVQQVLSASSVTHCAFGQGLASFWRTPFSHRSLYVHQQPSLLFRSQVRSFLVFKLVGSRARFCHRDTLFATGITNTSF